MIAEIGIWYDEYQDADLPFIKNVVKLDPEDSFMQIETVKNYIEEAPDHDCSFMIVATKQPNKRSVLLSLYLVHREAPYTFHRYSIRSNLKKFKVISEFSEQYVNKYIRNKATAEKFSI